VAPTHALKPVRGSVLPVACAVVAVGAEADGVADVDDDALADAVAGALEDEPEDGVEEWEPDPFEELLFDVPFEPPSGSVYCWSPAEGPAARAAGASSISAASMIKR
jgi:hypothetical protein